MSRTIDSFLTTLGLVSRVQIRRKYEPTYRRVAFFLPVVGLIVTVVLASTALVAQMALGDAMLVAIAVTVVQYAMFNLFHFDGLLDSADALLVFAERERRLEILRDVHHGSFALFGGVVYLITKLYVVYRLVAIVEPGSGAIVANWAWFVLIFGAAVSGRSAAAWIPSLLRPARPGGLGALLSENRFGHALGGFLVGAVCVALPWIILRTDASILDWRFLFLLIATPAAIVITGLSYRRKIGGYTGDTLGLAVELGELFHLIVLFLIVR